MIGQVGQCRHRRHGQFGQVAQHFGIGQAGIRDQQHILIGERVGGGIDPLGHADRQAILTQPLDGIHQIGRHLFHQQQHMRRASGGRTPRLLLDQGGAGERHERPEARRPRLVSADQRGERLPCHPTHG